MASQGREHAVFGPFEDPHTYNGTPGQERPSELHSSACSRWLRGLRATPASQARRPPPDAAIGESAGTCVGGQASYAPAAIPVMLFADVVEGGAAGGRLAAGHSAGHRLSPGGKLERGIL